MSHRRSRGVKLKGKRALVTGATAGIGAATAESLCAAGCDVIITGRRKERLEAQAADWSDRYQVQVTAAAFDVADRDAVAGVFAARPELGDVDILVNNAGLARGTDKMQEALPSDWAQMIETNIGGLLWMTRPVIQQMAARGDGHVINLGSVAGRWTYPGGGVYCATKAAVGALSEGLRLDLHGTGVRVTNIEPGLVETEFSVVRLGDETKAKAVYEGTRALTAMDVAETVLWCLQRPAHVNIQELVVFPTDQASVRDVHRR